MRQHVEELQRLHPRQIFARHASRQLRLLLNAADLVREGGRIVYSTCSMEPEENEQVVERFLRKRPEFVIEDAAPYVPDMFVDGEFIRILPHRHAIDGAFAVRLTKKRPGAERLMRAEEEMPLQTEEPAPLGHAATREAAA